MAQYFTQQRDVSSVTPVFIDDTDRVMKEADEIIQRQNAVNAYEERERANLIKNLRTIRDFERTQNSNNHQMLMRNMQQMVDIQREKASERYRDRQNEVREKSAQEKRTMDAIGAIINFGAKALEFGVEQAEQAVTKAAQDAQAEKKQQQDLALDAAITVPAMNEGPAFGVKVKQNAIDQVEIAKGAQATEARMSGLDIPSWTNLFLSPEKQQLLVNKVNIGNFTDDVIRRDFIANKLRKYPNQTITYLDSETKKPVTRTFKDITANGFKSPEELNYAYTKFITDELKSRVGMTDVNLYHKQFADLRGYIDDQARALSKNLSKQALQNGAEVALRNILVSNSTPVDIARGITSYQDMAATNPSLSHSQAIQNINTHIIPRIPIGQQEEVLEVLANAKNKDGGQFFGKITLDEFRESAAASRKRFNNSYKEKLDVAADEYAMKTFLAAKSDDGFVSFKEQDQVFRTIEDKIGRQFSHEQAYYIKQKVLKLVKDDADPKLAKQLWNDQLGSLELTKDENDQAYASGYITSNEHSNGEAMMKERDAIKIEGEQYSKTTIKSAFKTQVFNVIGEGKLPGQPADASANLAVAIAYDIYTSKLKSYVDQVDTEGNNVYSLQQAHDQAYNDVIAAISKGEGVFHVNDTDNKRGPFFSRLTPGRHTGSPKFPTKPTTPASQLGTSLTGVEGLEKLKTTSFPDLQSDYVNIRERAKLGLSYKPSEYLQAVADESGHSVTDIINTMLEANGETVRIKRESPLEILKSKAQSAPELQRLLDKITVPKLLSLQANMKDVMPHTTGTGPQAFHNMTSIGLKLKDANASKVADAWMKHTNGGRDLLEGSPLQQYQQISEMYDIPYVPAQVTLIAGLSPTMVAMQSQYQPIDRGGLFNLVMGGESSGDPLIFNRGTTNSTGRLPASATFGDVEQAQAERQVSAAGSWQGTPGVLNQGRVAAGIPDNANFNNLNTQSKAFWGLILNTDKRPALRDYLLGQSNDINAAHEELALEFAAIAGPSGKGSYDGDSAGNMANTKSADVRKALEQARAELMSNPVNFN